MRRVALLLMVLAGCGLAAAPLAPVAETLADGRSGDIAFETLTPYDFPELIDGTAPSDRISGTLRMPEGTGPVRAAMILSHGSAGAGGRQSRMAEHLVQQGIAAFTLDHFGPRGITSTVRDQLRLTEQTMAVDLFAAAALLATHPRIPADRIGAMGWSKGATAVTLAAVDRVATFAGAPPLASAVAFYPFCGFDLGDEPLASPLLLLLGGADDWTPAPPCENLVANWQSRGAPAEVLTFPDAPHGFDSRLFVTVPIGRAITVRDRSPACVLDLDPAGSAVTLDGRHRLTDFDARTAYLETCGVRGVHFGADRSAARAAYARIDQFLAARLSSAADR